MVLILVAAATEGETVTAHRTLADLLLEYDAFVIPVRPFADEAERQRCEVLRLSIISVLRRIVLEIGPQGVKVRLRQPRVFEGSLGGRSLTTWLTFGVNEAEEDDEDEDEPILFYMAYECDPDPENEQVDAADLAPDGSPLARPLN